MFRKDVLKLKKLADELRVLNDKINDAYWTFTRTARGKPPILVVPEAYKRRAEVENELRQLKRGARGKG